MKTFLRVLLGCLLCTSTLWAQPLNFSMKGIGPNHYEGCEDYEVTFRVVVPGSASIDDVELISGDRTETYIKTNEWKVTGRVYTFVYSFDAGTYNPILRVKRGGGNWEEEVLDSTLKVFTNPTARFRITGDSSQCFEGNEVCFKDISTMGKEKHRITGTSFDLGDGTHVKDKDSFCYSYPEPGKFGILLTVVDEKGCSDELFIDSHVEIYDNIGVEFRAIGPVGCPCTDIRFNNFTKLDTNKVDYWIWDWGTGNGKKSKDTFYMDTLDHRLNWWTGFKRRYCKDGYHSPKLVVVSKDGCKDSMILKDAVRVINYNFDITWVPDTPCFSGNQIRFNMPPRPNATSNTWTFGDPASMNLNTVRDDWSPSHRFVGGPSFYNVTLSILEPPCPMRDTTICYVKLKGPMAVISLSPVAFPNDCIDPVEIPKEHFLRIKYDECYRESLAEMDPAGDVVEWVTSNNSNKSLIDSYFVYCNPNIIGKTANNAVSAMGAGTNECNGQYVTDSIPIFEAPINGVNGNWRYRYRRFTQSGTNNWKWTDPMPYRDSLQITDSLIPVGGGAKVETTFWVHQPFLGLHKLNVNGTDYIYRIVNTPIKHNGGTYRPPMFRGTTVDDDGCGVDWRNMHDSDLVTRNCGGPNLVQFTNNSIKFRLRGRGKSQKPHHPYGELDNFPDAFSFPNTIDSCATNINWPWATDSMYYLWDFGDNSDQCTTYFDANRKIQVKGQNPSGDPLQCKFSELPVPQHYYIEEGCWVATLTATDDVTGCSSQATQTIIMEAPDAGPGDPLGALEPEDVDFYNQTEIQRQEDGNTFRKGLQLGVGGSPCVGNDFNPYFQRIDLSGTLPSCGRETFWMIFNRDDPHQGENDDPEDNDCERNSCITDGNGRIVKTEIKNRGALHPGGTHNVEWRVKNTDGTWGPAYAKGTATINALGFLDKVVITKSDSGYADQSKAVMVFTDSTGFVVNDVKQHPIEVYGYEQVDTFWYECEWYDETTLAGMNMEYSYTTAGCKTPGLVIKTGDCLDTFFYENYRYFIDANSDFLMNPHPNLYANEEEIREDLDPFDGNKGRPEVYKDVDHIICNNPDPSNPNILPTRLPYEITFSVKDYTRNDPMAAGDDSICDALDSARNFKYFISKTAGQCGRTSKGLLNDSLAMLPDGFKPITGGDKDLANLRDTLKWTIREPGKYVISTTSKAAHVKYSCFGSKSREIWMGQLQCFRYDDSVVCKEQTVTFTDSVYYWQSSDNCTFWPENTTCVDTGAYFYAPKNAEVRSAEYSNPKYTEIIAWDFNSPRFLTDENGDTVKSALGEPVRMEDWMLKMDSTRMEAWINPNDSSEAFQTYKWRKDANGDALFRETQWTYGATEEFGPGIYDVTLWARDSMGCWMPYTKHDAVRVVHVEANFALCDTCRDTLICTPSITGFDDLSEIIENKQDAPPTGRSYTKGKFDEIISWEWDFGDGRKRSILQNPAHSYLDANEKGYDVSLSVVTAQGCSSKIEMPKLVKVIGPKANFALLNDSICVQDSIFLHDSSESLTPATRIWTATNVVTNAKGAGRNTEGKAKKVGLWFDKPGDYYITQQLSGKVEDPITGVFKNCQDIYPNDAADEEPIKVHVRAFDTLKIDLSDTLFCPGDPMSAKVNDITYAGYDTFYWNIDGVESSNMRPDVKEFTFAEEGVYTVRLTGSGKEPICPTEDVETIRVKTVYAELNVDSARSNFDLGNYEFTNTSRNGKLYIWEIFEEGDTRNPIATFKRNDLSKLVYNDFVAGTYTIKLTVYDVENAKDSLLGCRDVDVLSIVVDPQIKFYNYFSPNGDGSNDIWSVTMQAIPEYELVIYNRWGEPMYRVDQDTDDDVICEEHSETGKRTCQFWDGTTVQGRPAPAGTYYFVFKYRFKGQDEQETMNGTITLIRGLKE